MHPEIKEKIVIVVHASYAGNADYFLKLKKLDIQLSQLSVTLIEKYLGFQEIAQLRLITDILIQMPESDALSAAMTEVLYSGNSCVVGERFSPRIFKTK